MSKKKNKKKKKYVPKINIRYFLSKLYKDIRHNPDLFYLCKLPKWIHGDCDYDRIRLDYRKDLYSTLIHEYIHYMYPDFTERMVLKEEVRIINSMSLRQIKNLMRTFSDNI